MHHADHPTDEIIAATGLTENEITTLINTQERQFDAYEAAGVEELLRWAEQHHLAGVRGRAARIKVRTRRPHHPPRRRNRYTRSR
ncbi:hypothetical protein [Streptomyces niveus]|uniref:hypothetical protein n=1 Tax=Streptomyces niveus TaxID=193462 RepID=UPI003639727A